MPSTSAEVGTEFGVAQLKANAEVYRAHKRIVDAAAAAKYDSIDDAIASLKAVVETFEAQIIEGAGYTPDRALGFGSDNAAQIAEKVMGLGTSDATVRKALNDLGK